uniref:(northern house mosquito) hypothetical protein n=1 Tax=Culex pipiens TaxID=7175 RepID=A0A8D8A1B7_CULPI
MFFRTFTDTVYENSCRCSSDVTATFGSATFEDLTTKTHEETALNYSLCWNTLVVSASRGSPRACLFDETVLERLSSALLPVTNEHKTNSRTQASSRLREMRKLVNEECVSISETEENFHV